MKPLSNELALSIHLKGLVGFVVPLIRILIKTRAVRNGQSFEVPLPLHPMQ